MEEDESDEVLIESVTDEEESNGVLMEAVTEEKYLRVDSMFLY